MYEILIYTLCVSLARMQSLIVVAAGTWLILAIGAEAIRQCKRLQYNWKY